VCGAGHLLSRWLIAWVGDCRIYRLRATHDEPAELLTRDDTYRHLGEAPPPGGSPDDPARMVGNGAIADPNVASVQLGDGEMLVLCSDGCTSMSRRRRSIDSSARADRWCVAALAWSSSRALMAVTMTATVLAIHGSPTRHGAAMNPEQIDRVFGRGRLRDGDGRTRRGLSRSRAPGERRRYTKRFLNSTGWRLRALDGARMAHSRAPHRARHRLRSRRRAVRSRPGPGTQLVQTYDAGVTVDQWATLLAALSRRARVPAHVRGLRALVALAHYCVKALKEVHQLQLVHLDIKGDNVCIPFGPATSTRTWRERRSIRCSASLPSSTSHSRSSRVRTSPSHCPSAGSANTTINRRVSSRRLPQATTGDLSKTRELDWRCDIYSLAAMLKRYLPGDAAACTSGTRNRVDERALYDAARALIVALRRHHDEDAPERLPHQSIIDTTAAILSEGDLAQSLAAGWTLAPRRRPHLRRGFAADPDDAHRAPGAGFPQAAGAGKGSPAGAGVEAPRESVPAHHFATPALAFAAPHRPSSGANGATRQRPSARGPAPQ
jgi:hypothetical protein